MQLTKLYFPAAQIPSLTDPWILVFVTTAQTLCMSNRPDITSKLCIIGMLVIVDSKSVVINNAQVCLQCNL